MHLFIYEHLSDFLCFLMESNTIHNILKTKPNDLIEPQSGSFNFGVCVLDFLGGGCSSFSSFSFRLPSASTPGEEWTPSECCSLKGSCHLQAVCRQRSDAAGLVGYLKHELNQFRRFLIKLYFSSVY